MRSAREIVEAELPEQGFFSLRELETCTPYSADYWSKRIKDGEVRAIQRTARTPGSPLSVPRGEVVTHLVGQLR